MSRLAQKYKKEIIPAMRKSFDYKNIMAVPKIEKTVVNIGFGRAAVLKDAKALERIKEDIIKITGQMPVARKAKKSISTFKLREGMEIGLMVTLRGKRMYDFIDRLVSVAIPRSKDFRGIDLKSFDEKGNLNIGIKEQNVFPEISYESQKDIFSLQVTVTNNAKTKKEGVELLKLFGFPIKAPQS